MNDDNQKTKNSKKSKRWQEMLESELLDNSDSTNSTDNEVKPPRLKSRNRDLAEKLDYLIDESAKQGDVNRVSKNVDSLSNKLDESKQTLKEQLKDQSSKVVKAVADARAIGYSDGLVGRVDAMEQKVGGLEADINLREQNLDQKTQECIAKVADLDQAGKYLENYTQAVNNRLVPTMRNLILAMRNGITHHTEEVTNDVYQQLKKDTGLSVDEIIKTAVSQDFTKERESAEEASASAKLSAKASQQSVRQIATMLGNFMTFLIVFGIELVILVAVVAVTPGWQKLAVAPISLIMCAFLDWKIYKKGGWS